MAQQPIRDEVVERIKSAIQEARANNGLGPAEVEPADLEYLLQFTALSSTDEDAVTQTAVRISERLSSYLHDWFDDLPDSDWERLTVHICDVAVDEIRERIAARLSVPDEPKRSLVEQMRYHQTQAAILAQRIVGDPCKGVVMEKGPDGYLRPALSPNRET